MQEAPSETGRPRRAGADALWVFALLFLIAPHILFAYSPRESWHVVSSHNGYWADYLITLVQSWYLALAFFLSGAALRPLLERDTLGGFATNRAIRLLVPFLFTVVVIVPPLRFVRLDDLGIGSGQSYLEYVTQAAPFVVPYLGVRLPMFSDAWILTYWFAYSVLVGLFWRFAPTAFRACQNAVERLPVGVLVLVAMAWFAYMAAVVFPVMPPSGMLPTDFGAHMKFAPVFLMGALVGNSAQFLAKLDTAKLRLWAATATLALINVGLLWLYLHEQLHSPFAWHVARGAFGGAMLFSVVAFGLWAFNRPSTALAYASDAILPVYLMHQTCLVVAADFVFGLHWPLALELLTVAAAAVLAPLVIYQVLVRYVSPMRTLFGLPSRRAYVPP